MVNADYLAEFIVDIGNIRIAEEVGQGAFGIVHRGIVHDLEPGQRQTDVALKLTRGMVFFVFLMTLYHILYASKMDSAS